MADQNNFDQQDNSMPTSSTNSSPLPQSTPTTLVSYIEPEHEQGYLIDDSTYSIIELILFVILGIITGLMGTVTNVINIAVFVKQGLFSGGSVLNLFCLAIVDFGVAFTNLLHGISITIMNEDIPHLPIDPFAVIYLGIGWPHSIFTVLNRLLTAFIAFERCMCVVIPFRVRNIFAPRRSGVYLIIIFAYGLLSHVPVYIIHRVEDVKREGTNATQLRLVFTADRQFWYYIIYYTNYFFLSLLSSIIVSACTVTMSVHIKISKEWRKRMSGAVGQVSKNTSIATCDVKPDVYTSSRVVVASDKVDKNHVTKGSIDKETRLVKMITTISIIFVVCYIPEMLLTIFKSLDDRINTGGQYQRLSNVINVATFLFGTINSSINVFVYHKMSSKYKEIFLLWCGRSIKET